jgi:hypothetical protein
MGDLALNSDRDLLIENDDLSIIEGTEEIAQDLDTRLNFWKGEWFLDTRLGTPWLEKVLGQKPRLIAVKSIVRKVALDTPGVIGLTDLTLEYESTVRTLSISMRVQGTEGEFLYERELIVD